MLFVMHADGAPQLELHDAGTDLSEADFARARAVRPEAVGWVEGAGLGLVVVDGLASDHGLIVALCRGGGGTGIPVTLPVA